MTKKIGHNYIRDPYPWDGAETLAGSASWACCGMSLPSTYLTCPMCERERGADGESGTGMLPDDDGAAQVGEVTAVSG